MAESKSPTALPWPQAHPALCPTTARGLQLSPSPGVTGKTHTKTDRHIGVGTLGPPRAAAGPRPLWSHQDKQGAVRGAQPSWQAQAQSLRLKLHRRAGRHWPPRQGEGQGSLDVLG